MRIHFLGGASEVGASCVVIEAGGQRVLVDAGVRPGAADPLPDLARLQEGSGIDAVVVTHAHADHIGAPYFAMTWGTHVCSSFGLF